MLGSLATEAKIIFPTDVDLSTIIANLEFPKLFEEVSGFATWRELQACFATWPPVFKECQHGLRSEIGFQRVIDITLYVPEMVWPFTKDWLRSRLHQSGVPFSLVGTAHEGYCLLEHDPDGTVAIQAQERYAAYEQANPIPKDVLDLLMGKHPMNERDN